MTNVDPLEEIKRLYYQTTRATIQQDLARAIDLLKTLPSEDERQKVAVYMDGLSQMRSEWANSGSPSSGQRSAAARGRSGRSKGSSGRDR